MGLKEKSNIGCIRSWEQKTREMGGFQVDFWKMDKRCAQFRKYWPFAQPWGIASPLGTPQKHFQGLKDVISKWTASERFWCAKLPPYILCNFETADQDGTESKKCHQKWKKLCWYMRGRIGSFKCCEFRAVSQLRATVVDIQWGITWMWRRGCYFFVVKMYRLNGEGWDVRGSVQTWLRANR